MSDPVKVYVATETSLFSSRSEQKRMNTLTGEENDEVILLVSKDDYDALLKDRDEALARVKSQTDLEEAYSMLSTAYTHDVAKLTALEKQLSNLVMALKKASKYLNECLAKAKSPAVYMRDEVDEALAEYGEKR